MGELASDQVYDWKTRHESSSSGKTFMPLQVPCHSSVRRRRRRFQFARTYHPPMFLPGNKFRVYIIFVYTRWLTRRCRFQFTRYIFAATIMRASVRNGKWKDVFLLFFFFPPWIDPSFEVGREVNIRGRGTAVLHKLLESNNRWILNARRVPRYLQSRPNPPLFHGLEATIARVNAAFVAFGRAMN